MEQIKQEKINKALVENYDWLQKTCKNITKNNELWPDLAQEVVLVLLGYNKDKIIVIIDNNHLKYWLTTVIINLWSSNTSPFYKKFRKLNDISSEITDFDFKEEEYDFTIDECVEKVMNDINNLTFYNKKVVEIRLGLKKKHKKSDTLVLPETLKEKSYTDMSKITKIPRNSLFNTFKQVKEKLKDKDVK